MRIDTETKSFKFKEDEKYFLYETLREPAKIKYTKFLEKFNIFLKETIENIYDKDLIWLVSRRYCLTTSYFCIDPVKLGLPNRYGDDKTKIYVDVAGRNMRISELFFPIVKDVIKDNDITLLLLDKCSDDVLEQLKSNLLELAKLRFEFEYFGLGTFIRNESYFYNRPYFKEIDTWGQLYDKSPEYYKIIYDHYLGEKDTVNEEVRLLKKLKIVLRK